MSPLPPYALAVGIFLIVLAGVPTALVLAIREGDAEIRRAVDEIVGEREPEWEDLQ